MNQLGEGGEVTVNCVLTQLFPSLDSVTTLVTSAQRYAVCVPNVAVHVLEVKEVLPPAESEEVVIL